VWIIYADLLRDPMDAFAFLESRSIGQGLALFYEARSAVLETRGDFKLAAEVLDLGLARRARPFERLQTKREEFNQRMARRVREYAAAEAEGGTSERHHQQQQQARAASATRGAIDAVVQLDENGKPARAALGDARSRGISGAGLGPTQALQGARAVGNSKAEGFVVFDGGDGSGGAQPGVGPTNPSWSSLGTTKLRTKENTVEAGPWAGQGGLGSAAVSQLAAHAAAQGAPAQRRAESFRPFVEDENGDRARVTTSLAAGAAQVDHQQQQQQQAGNRGLSRPVAALRAAADRATAEERAHAHMKSLVAPPAGSKVSHGYRVDLLAHEGAETCFEEARARGYRAAKIIREAEEARRSAAEASAYVKDGICFLFFFFFCMSKFKTFNVVR
jgi:hypothetical protein